MYIRSSNCVVHRESEMGGTARESEMGGGTARESEMGGGTALESEMGGRYGSGE